MVCENAASRLADLLDRWVHASIQSTEIYLRADPTEKLDALAMGIPPALKRGKFQVPDKLLAMCKKVGKGG